MGIKQPWLKKPKTKPELPGSGVCIASARALLQDAEQKFSRRQFAQAAVQAKSTALKAAEALLAWRDLDIPRTERGLLDLFEKEIVQPGHVQPALGQALHQILASAPTELETRQAIKKAGLFLDRARDIVT
ncbi:MAG: hypothetical protein ACE5FW_03605 [Candidatus Aenigmatarchaeota archaeon]